MGCLRYSAITSVDGYVCDTDGRFDWAAPDVEVHAFVNDLERSTGTFWLGRRMYQVMAVWETMGGADDDPVIQDFAAIWRAADKVVFSRTLTDVATSRTELRHDLDVARLRGEIEQSPRTISVGGPTLAGVLLRAGLVTEVDLLVVPVIVGGGTSALPDGLVQRVSLVDVRRFANGTVHQHYTVGG